MRSSLLALVAAAALSAAPLLAQPLSLGPEILVTPEPFHAGSLAVSPEGGFAISSERVRFFTADDRLAGTGERIRRVNWLATRGNGFVEIWVRDASNFQLGQVVGRLYDAAGQAVSPEIVLVDGARRALLAGDPAGGFVVAWWDFGFRLQVRRFDAQGNPAGPIVQAEQETVVLALLPGGGFAVAGTDERFTEVFVRLYRPDGAPAGPKILLAEGIQLSSSSGVRIAADGSGRVVVVWARTLESGGEQLWAQRLDAGGRLLGPAFLVVDLPVASRRSLTLEHDVAARPDGRFLVLWGEADAVGICGGPGGDGCIPWPHENGDVWARGYDAAGAPLGPAFLVSDSTQGHQEPGLAAASPSGWLVAWTTVDGPATGLRVRRILAPCGAGTAPALCLQGGRFRAEVTWRVPATGATGTGAPIPRTGDTGAFWFFSPANYELVVKVLDGRGVNGHFWVFYGSLTDVEFDLTITDTLTGAQRTYHNPAGTMASRADTEAF